MLIQVVQGEQFGRYYLPHAAGVALLAGACALAGTAADRARRVRLRALESWCAAAETLAAELEYRAPPLPLLLETAARQGLAERNRGGIGTGVHRHRCNGGRKLT